MTVRAKDANRPKHDTGVLKSRCMQLLDQTLLGPDAVTCDSQTPVSSNIAVY